MSEITAMLDAIEEVRNHADSFDLDEHNDEGNELKIESIRALCDTLESTVEDLVP